MLRRLPFLLLAWVSLRAHAAEAACAPVDRAFNGPTQASGYYVPSGGVPARAVDHNYGTSWASDSSTGAWLTVDLGGTYPLQQLEAEWNWDTNFGATAGSDFQVSLDGGGWTTVATSTHVAADNGRCQAFSLPSVDARYIRFLATSWNGGWGNLTELHAFDCPLTNPCTGLAFATPPRTFPTGNCGGQANVITVQLESATGIPVNAGAGGQSFTATTSSTGGSWFLDSTCSTPALGGGFTVPSGSSSVNLYYRDTVAGSPSVSLTSPFFPRVYASPQRETVSSTVAAQLVFTTPLRTFIAGACGGAGLAVTVQLEDATGAAISAGAGGLDVTALSSSSGGVFFTDSACTLRAPHTTGWLFTVPSGASTLNLYYLDTHPGIPSISLTNASGLTNPPPQVDTVLAPRLPPYGVGCNCQQGTAPPGPTALLVLAIVAWEVRRRGGLKRRRGYRPPGAAPITSSERSMARAEWVSAPIEM